MNSLVWGFSEVTDEEGISTLVLSIDVEDSEGLTSIEITLDCEDFNFFQYVASALDKYKEN